MSTPMSNYEFGRRLAGTWPPSNAEIEAGLRGSPPPPSRQQCMGTNCEEIGSVRCMDCGDAVCSDHRKAVFRGVAVVGHVCLRCQRKRAGR